MRNKIYVANQNDNTVTVIDGVSNSTITIPVGGTPYSVAVNPVTNKVYVANISSNTVTVINEQKVRPIPLTTQISPLPGNKTNSPDPRFTFRAHSGTATTPDGVYFQVDTWQKGWGKANDGRYFYSGAAQNLKPGFHILYAYAVDGQQATSTQTGSPLIGQIQAYGFLVTPQ